MDNIANSRVVDELRLLEELEASEELNVPFYWIEESNGYGELTAQAEEVALKYHEPKENGNILFKKEDVEGLFQGWGMMIF